MCAAETSEEGNRCQKASIKQSCLGMSTRTPRFVRPTVEHFQPHRRGRPRLCQKRFASPDRGKIQTRTWDDRESGQNKYRIEILVDDLTLLGGRSEDRGRDSGCVRGRK